MKYEMQCGHVQEYHPGVSRIPGILWTRSEGLPDEFMRCEECNTFVRLAAIECREWRYNCSHCRFNRWAGQSKTLALDHGARHSLSTGHLFGHTDYSRVVWLAAKVRSIYGHSVKIFVIDSAVRGIKAPDTRQYIPDVLEYPDEPPF